MKDSIRPELIQPFFSIIIPTYNSAEKLSACLESVINQSFQNFEIIIVDKLSTDATFSLVESYKKTHFNIRWISEMDNGIYDAMNKGMLLSKGDWLYFLGSDDVISNNHVFEEVFWVDKGDYDVVYGNAKIVGNSSWAKDGELYDGNFDLEKLLKKNICQQAVFYNKTCFSGNSFFNASYKLCADWDFNLRCWAQKEFLYINTVVVDFYAGGKSTQFYIDKPFIQDFSKNLLKYFGDTSKKKAIIDFMQVKQVAIYLPQYHSILENDQAWGKGFTDWVNVKKAKPLFDGHEQPHVPHQMIGYYDLNNHEVLIKQAALAQEHNIYGFAYYHYWFNGKRLLNAPLDKMLKSGTPNFPFCYIWANENWTRGWDGSDDEIIISQNYSFEDDVNHIEFLCKNVFSDKRYIQIDGKPLFLIYRTELFTDIKSTAGIWRKEAKKHGFKDLYLVRVENFKKNVLPSDIDFDAAMEFAPDWSCTNTNPLSVGNITIFDYAATVYNTISKTKPYKYFHSVFPGWDNTPRRVGLPSFVFVNNTTSLFKFFLERQLGNTLKKFSNRDEKIVFINGWNEWGEGCHIEPDQKNGMEYLNICKNAKPKIAEGYEMYCMEQADHLREKTADITNELEKSHQKYNGLLQSSEYKIGKKILSKYHFLRNFFR